MPPPTPNPPVLDAPIPSANARLLWVCLAHAAVDFFSYLIVPIVTVLEASANFTHDQDPLLLALGSISSGVIQPIVAIISDRSDTRWLGTAGAVVAAIALSLIGFAHSLPVLLLLQVLGSAGVGAFHPVAAAAVGHLSRTHRARGVAIFYSAGMFGGIACSFITPFYVSRFGLPALAWLIPPGLFFAILLAWAIHSIPHRHATARADHASLSAPERRARWRDITLLYLGNVIRFVVNMMLVQLLIRWSEQHVLTRANATVLTDDLRHSATAINGPLQAAMAIGMGISGIAVGWLVRPKAEKPLLIIVPFLGAISIAAFPYAATAGGVPAAFILALIGGIGYAGVMPITITMAQRLLPHRTILASGLMMGGAWSIAAIGPAIAQRLYSSKGLHTSYLAAAGILLISVVLGAMVGRRPK